MKFLIYIFLTILIFNSCSASFKKNGYYFQDKKHQSYYGNDAEKIYINFSDKFVYNEIGFNAHQLSTADVKLLQEFKLEPQNLLFSYHSNSGRQAMAFILKRNNINFSEYQQNTENGFYYKMKEEKFLLYRENIYPFGKNFVKVIEKSPIFKNKDGEKIIDEKTRIFPEILTSKPATK